MESENQKLAFLESTPKRLDVFLVQTLGVSRNYVHGLIEQGKVRIEGKAAKKSTLLLTGQSVILTAYVHPSNRELTPCKKQTFEWVYENEIYGIINKPHGLPTHPNSFDEVNTLAQQVLHQVPSVRGVGEDPLRPGVVHRLDSNTSGLLIFAKTQATWTYFRNLFNQRQVKKNYLALCLGITPKEGQINFKLAHHEKNPRKMVALVNPKVRHRGASREALTFFKTLEQTKSLSLLNVKTITGRMHQVRVHLSASGFPLVGDPLYQTGEKRQADHCGLTRHFLHAAELSFVCPLTQTPKTFQSDLSQDLQKVLTQSGFVFKGSALGFEVKGY